MSDRPPPSKDPTLHPCRAFLSVAREAFASPSPHYLSESWTFIFLRFPQVALSLERHPLLLMIPATIACSYAFMLPIATPPNAIAYSTGYFKMTDMARPGMVMNIIGIGLLAAFIPTLGEFFVSKYCKIMRCFTWRNPRISATCTKMSVRIHRLQIPRPNVMVRNSRNPYAMNFERPFRGSSGKPVQYLR